MSDLNVNAAPNEFNIPMEMPAEETPATLEETLAALAKIVGEADDPPPAAPAAEPKPGEKSEPAPDPAEAALAAEKARIDSIMESLQDESEAVQKAVRAALEAGADAKATLASLVGERAAAIEARETMAAEEQLVADMTALVKVYPGLTQPDLEKTLEHLSKLPKHLAEELSLEEVATRTLGRDTLEARRTAAPALGGRAPSAERTPGAATIIGDATPGPGSAPPEFDAGSGGDFMDIANHITKHHASSLVQGASR